MASSETRQTQQPQPLGARKYRGNCHCGAFVFEASFDGPITRASECICSVCTKKGYTWVTPRGDLDVVHDEGLVKGYTFGPAQTEHMFCGRCGTPIMARNSTRGTLINARVLQDLDIAKLEVKLFENPAGPAYEPVPYTGPEPAAEVPDANVYHGSCHCGRVRIAVKLSGVLDETFTGTVWECNCSICQRGAYIWAYPNKDQVAVEGKDQLKYYVFGNRIFRKAFCGHCGVHLTNEIVSLTDEQVAALPAELQAVHAYAKHWHSVTLRALDGVDIRKVKSELQDRWSLGKPPYVNP